MRYVLIFIILCGCTSSNCLTSEAKLFQRHYYDQKNCVKRNKIRMWWDEHGEQGLILSKKEEKKLYKNP
jgi:hypothetical protein